jgi:hypothetical protein
VALTLLWALFGLLTLWAVATLYFDARVAWLRLPLAAIYGLGMLAVLTWVRPRRLAAGNALTDIAQLPFAPSARPRTASRGIGGC